MILEFLPHRACDSILPTLISVSLPHMPFCMSSCSQHRTHSGTPAVKVLIL